MGSTSKIKNYLGLDESLSRIETAKVGVVQAPLENSTSFQKGTALGPRAFIEASQQVELYDIETGKDFSEVGVFTFPEPDFSKTTTY